MAKGTSAVKRPRRDTSSMRSIGRRDPLRLPRRRSAHVASSELHASLRNEKELLVLRNPLRGEPIECLLERLDSSDERIRFLATEALGGDGPKASSAVPALIKLLMDDSRRVRYAAAQAIGAIGTHGEVSAPALVQLFSVEEDLSPDSPTISAVISLAKIARHKPYQVLTLLWKEASHTVPSARIAAIKCLYRIGLQSPKLLDESLERAKNSKIASLQQTAAVLHEKLAASSQ